MKKKNKVINNKGDYEVKNRRIIKRGQKTVGVEQLFDENS
jgi:hypothetical protein